MYHRYQGYQGTLGTRGIRVPLVTGGTRGTRDQSKGCSVREPYASPSLPVIGQFCCPMTGPKAALWLHWVLPCEVGLFSPLWQAPRLPRGTAKACCLFEPPAALWGGHALPCDNTVWLSFDGARHCPGVMFGGLHDPAIGALDWFPTPNRGGRSHYSRTASYQPPIRCALILVMLVS